MSQIVKDKEINPLYNSKHGLSIQKHNRLLDSTPSKRSTSVFLDHPMKDHQPVSQFDSCDFVDKIKRHEQNMEAPATTSSVWTRSKAEGAKRGEIDERIKQATQSVVIKSSSKKL